MTRSSRTTMIIVLIVLILSVGGIFLYKFKIFGGAVNAGSESGLPAIKIILTNGCGYEGLAREFSTYLEDKNIDIVSMGNTRKPIYDKTIIVVRKGDTEDLERLQRMTGIERFTEARTETALADFEIIIGRDYQLYKK